MRHHDSARFVVFAAMLCFVSTLTLQAQWQRVKSLEGIYVNDFTETTNGTLYVVPSPDDGLYYSEDGGDSWIHREDLDAYSIATIQTTGENLYFLARQNSIPTLHRQIYRLQYPEAAVENIPSPRGGWVGSICCTPDGWLYATLEGIPATDSVYLSTDAGQTWTGVCAKYSDAMGKNSLLVDAQKRIWSHDQWSLAYFDAPSGEWIKWQGYGFKTSNKLHFFVQPNGDVYSNDGDRIARYIASSQTFIEIFRARKTVSPVLQFWVTAGGNLLAAEQTSRKLAVPSSVTGDYEYFTTLHRSTDAGASWRVIDSTLPEYLSFLGESGGAIFGTFGSEIMRTKDFGSSFEDCTHGIASKSFWRFETRGSDIHIQALRYAFSSDSGENWTSFGHSNGSNPNGLQVISDGTMFENRGMLRISRDSAATWEEPFAYAWENSVMDYLALDDVVVVSFIDSTIRRSVDKGKTWEQVHRGRGVVMNMNEVHEMMYATEDNALLISSDRGLTWAEKNLPVFGDVVLTANDRVLLLSTGSMLLASTNGGDTWTTNSSDTIIAGIKRFAVNADGVFAAIRASTPQLRTKMDVILSSDDGRSWNNITTDLPSAFTSYNSPMGTDLGFTSDSKLFVNVNGRGLYVYDNVPVNVNACPQYPGDFILSVWPTCAANTIRLQVNSAESTEIAVYDVTGSLISEFILPPGEMTTAIDVANWQTGAYFVRAAEKGQTAVKTFFILR